MEDISKSTYSLGVCYLMKDEKYNSSEFGNELKSPFVRESGNVAIYY